MSILRQVARGVAALLRGRETDRDIDAEVRQYLDASADAYERQGMCRADALRAATLAMGNVAYTREMVRTAGWEHHVETTLADARFALRRLSRSPGFAVTAIATLGLGIGASTAVFSAIEPVLLQPLPFPMASRLVTVDDRNPEGIPMPATLGTYVELKARSRSFEAIAAADNWQPSISGTRDPERLTGEHVSPEYFDVYGVRPSRGRGFTRDDAQPGGPRLVIVSDRLVQRHFAGNRGIVGRTIDLDGDPYTVIGIMPPSFTNVIAPATELWTPLRDVVSGDFNGRAWGITTN